MWDVTEDERGNVPNWRNRKWNPRDRTIRPNTYSDKRLWVSGKWRKHVRKPHECLGPYSFFTTAVKILSYENVVIDMLQSRPKFITSYLEIFVDPRTWGEHVTLFQMSVAT